MCIPKLERIFTQERMRKMKLSQSLEGKKVHLVDSDGDVFRAKVTDYIYPEDNEPEGIASVIIWDEKNKRSIEFLEPDIRTLEVMSE